MKLIEELFANGILTEDRAAELKSVMEKTAKTEEEVLLENGIIAETALFQLKSKLLRVPLKSVRAQDVPPDVLSVIPQEASVNYKMCAFAKNENFYQIGMVYPENILAQNALRFLATQEKFSYHVYLITLADFANLQKQRQAMGSEVKKALAQLDEEKQEILKDLKTGGTSAQMVADDAPVVKMAQVILRHAVEQGASDIHIEPLREKLVVRFRKHGVLHIGLTLPPKVHAAIAARIKILAGLKIDESRVPQDGRFSATIDGREVDFRVATFPTLYGEKVELRILDASVGARSFEELGLEGRNLDVVKEAIKKPYGMILFTGPTGSGKTTTQYAILHILNQESVNIVTVEDPIEYAIDGVNQSQVKPEIGYTFAQGLRQILRQDPNIIMVGEIRDEETAGLAVNAALTGHVVLSTLHTNSSVGVVARLLDMGVKPFLIPSTLRAVISQRLIRTLCKQCKVKVKPTPRVRDYIMERINGLPAKEQQRVEIPSPLYIYQAKGCEACGNTGYAGRAGLFEVLSMSDALADLILGNPLEHALLKVAREQGMVTMDQAGVMKILAGETTVEEVERATVER